jgi:MGT family glycosyltransferase
MKKIVFFCIPAHGHTNPTLSVVKELISLGHEVIYYSYNSLKEKIEETGARFVSCDDYDMEQKLSPKDSARIGKDLAFSTKILVDTTLSLDEKVSKEMEELKPDCIVYDSMAPWGKAVAIKLKIPYVCSTTTFAFNKYSAKIMKQDAKDIIKMILSLGKISKDIKRLQQKGYNIKSVLDLIGNDENADTIVYTSPEFQPFSETFSDKFSFVGPSIRESTGNFQKKSEKLIYISMGTVNNDMLPLYKNCIKAFENTDYQVVISIGNLVSPADFEKLPENIEIYNFTDQIAVLKKADVFLTHCGMNSVSESLYFGVPLVMLPQTKEQSGVAQRVLQFSAGIKLEKTDPETILNTTNRVLSDDSYKLNAEKISIGFKNSKGAKGAAEKIISICKE